MALEMALGGCLMRSHSVIASAIGMSMFLSILSFVPFTGSAAPGASIVPGISDYGQDTDADGLYDYLCINVTINVTVAGDYMVELSVNGTDGYPIDGYGIGGVYFAGVQTICLKVHGDELWHHGTDGPYLVWVRICSEGPYTPLDGYHGVTQAYTYTQFEPLPAVLQWVTERVVDADGNGRNEFIIADLYVNVSVAQEYKMIFQVLKYDIASQAWMYLAEVEEIRFLPVGVDYVSITARGSGIQAGGLDGPYYYLMLLYDGPPLFVRNLDSLWYLTAPYEYSEFESGSLDSPYSTVIPDIDGVFSDGEWDDATAVNLSRPDMENPFGAFLLVKNSDTMLYVCMDAVGDLTDNAGDSATVAFDTGNDHDWTNNEEDQFMVGRGTGNTMHSLYDEAGASWFTNTHCVPFDETAPDHAGLEGAAGFGNSSRESANHSVYELAIPLALIGAEPCDVIALATAGHRFDTMGIFDASRGNWSSWPYYLPQGPFPVDYGEILLGWPQVSTRATVTGYLGNDGWYVSPVNVTLSSTGGWLGPLSTMIWPDEENGLLYQTPVKCVAEGNHSFAFQTCDHSSAWETVKSVEFKIDLNAPVTTATVSGRNLTLNSSDRMSGVDLIRYQVDGGSWENYTGKLVLSGDVNHTVAYYSVDHAGNVEEIKTVTVEKEPGGQVTAPPPSPIGWIVLAVIAIAVFAAVLAMRRNSKASESKMDGGREEQPPPG